MQYRLLSTPPRALLAGLTLLGMSAPAWVAARAAAPGPASRSKTPVASEALAVLGRRCGACHGAAKSGGLDLRTRESMLRGGKRGPALAPGSPDKSLIALALQGRGAPRMPPSGPLPAAEQQVLRRWIAAGAPWEPWWAFRPLRRPAAPPVRRKSWVRSPIDAFVLAKMEAHTGPARLAPAPPAARRDLLRRVTFGLTGLPPTPEEMDGFLADRSPDAYEKVVERLLASPRYGERWARHWLDIVRFAESQGFERDKIRDNAWRYRDYVIRAFNSDKPYDRFVREQIAGDVLPDATPESITATGFLVAGPYDEVGHEQPSLPMRARVRQDELEDIVSVTGQTFLGLTVNCARCHDHKFDPISLKDYYRFQAALTGVRHGERSLLPAAEKAALDAQTAPIKRRIAELDARIAAPENAAERPRLVTERDALKQEEARVTAGEPRVYAANPVVPPPVHVLNRGNLDLPGELVAPGALDCLPGHSGDLGAMPDSPDAERRLKLANWITDPRNPLTSRVMVNRVWQYHFGKGLAENSSDFGLNGGDPPVHRELLDWMAYEFSKGWSVKALHRLIVTSNTYRQSTAFDAAAHAADAENRLLWRMPARRLEAEEIRDAMLSASGQIDLREGGPGFRPFSVFIQNSHFYTYEDRLGPEYNRRSIYRTVVNSGGVPLLEALDCPDPSVKTPRRGSTTTPLQALSLLNSSFVLRQARCLAERVEKQAGSDPAQQVAGAYRLTVNRGPRPAEAARGTTFVREHGLPAFCRVLLNSSEFVYVR